jgi:hypothetical protein
MARNWKLVTVLALGSADPSHFLFPELAHSSLGYMITVIWTVVQCNLSEVHCHFISTCCPHHKRVTDGPDDEGSKYPGVTTQKTTIFILAAVRTSNPSKSGFNQSGSTAYTERDVIPLTTNVRVERMKFLHIQAPAPYNVSNTGMSLSRVWIKLQGRKKEH